MSGKFISIGLVKISFSVEEIYTVNLDNRLQVYWNDGGKL